MYMVYEEKTNKKVSNKITNRIEHYRLIKRKILD